MTSGKGAAELTNSQLQDKMGEMRMMVILEVRPGILLYCITYAVLY